MSVELARAPQAFRVKDLSWIDGFYRGMRPYIFTREEDGVVILPPNQVYKANPSGIAILRHLQRGGTISRLPGIADGERAKQVNDFFTDLRDFCAGDTRSMDARASVERVPYTFSYTSLPILGEIAVTYRCNNACIFCYAGCGRGGAACHGAPPSRAARADAGAAVGAHGGSAAWAATWAHDDTTAGALTEAAEAQANADAGREMSQAEIKRIIRIFQTEARIPFFSFTGGEPLLRPDLEALIGYAGRIGLRVNLITNAALADASRARSLFRSGLRTAQVSVEAPNEEIHDLLTDRPGSFRLTLAGIKNLQSAGIHVQTNTTVTALNSREAPSMPEFLKGLGVERFAMNLYIPRATVTIPAQSLALTPTPAPDRDALLFPYSDAGPLIEAVRGAAREHGMTFYWYSPIPHCLYNPIAKGLGNKSCAAMDGLLSVSPTGDVLPCSSYPKSMGNLLTQRFRDIWFSAEALHFKNKEYAPPQCAGCEGFRACQSACPLYWERAGTGEIRNPAVKEAGRS